MSKPPALHPTSLENILMIATTMRNKSGQYTGLPLGHFLQPWVIKQYTALLREKDVLPIVAATLEQISELPPAEWNAP